MSSRLATVFLLIASLSASAFAQDAGPQYIGIGPRLGVQLKDPTALVLGAEGRFGVLQIAPTVRFDLRGQFNYFVKSDFTWYDLDADALFAFDIHQDTIEPYAFAGLVLGHISQDIGFATASTTDVGLNIGGGARFLQHQRIQPYAEIRFTVGNYDPIVLSGGVLFLIK